MPDPIFEKREMIFGFLDQIFACRDRQSKGKQDAENMSYGNDVKRSQASNAPQKGSEKHVIWWFLQVLAGLRIDVNILISPFTFDL